MRRVFAARVRGNGRCKTVNTAFAGVTLPNAEERSANASLRMAVKAAQWHRCTGWNRSPAPLCRSGQRPGNGSNSYKGMILPGAAAACVDRVAQVQEFAEDAAYNTPSPILQSSTARNSKHAIILLYGRRLNVSLHPVRLMTLYRNSKRTTSEAIDILHHTCRSVKDVVLSYSAVPLSLLHVERNLRLIMRDSRNAGQPRTGQYQ